MTITIQKLDDIIYPHIGFDQNLITSIISIISTFYIKEKKIELIFVLDQINLVLGDPGLQEQYRFLKSIIHGYKTVLSASANNEIELLDVSITTIQSPNIQFSFEELNALLSLYPSDLKYVKTVEDANQVL